jgi:aspartate ammonia-lyase
MTIQAAIRVMANDQAITMAAAHGELELNALEPLIADSLLESLSLLERTVFLLRVKCVETLNADPERCLALLEASCAFAASYVPALGYDKVAEIIARCGGEAEKVKKELDALI